GFPDGFGGCSARCERWHDGTDHWYIHEADRCHQKRRRNRPLLARALSLQGAVCSRPLEVPAPAVHRNDPRHSFFHEGRPTPSAHFHPSGPYIWTLLRPDYRIHHPVNDGHPPHRILED